MTMEVKIVKRLLKANDEWATRVREILEEKKIYAVNFISAPGSGKTTLLEATADALKNQFSLMVLEGDIATTRDADRISKHGIPAIQLLTEGSCHLDASLIYRALEANPPDKVDFLFIENVGNLVCPSEYDLGEAAKVALLSVPEGDDKVLKYPKLFREAKCVILNKVDLVEYMNFNKDVFYEDMSKLNPQAKIIEVSCRTGAGLEDWYQWLKERKEN
jgi:hydrogenase nickel incorporation protein HypB